MYNIYKRYRGHDLVLAINLAAGLSIFFFGVSRIALSCFMLLVLTTSLFERL